MNKNIKNIAIVRLSALGDIVNSAVVLQFIHTHYPDAKIEWITEEVFAPLLQNHPLISKVHTINLKKVKKTKSLSLFKETVKKLRNLNDFDIVIDMQGLLKSAIVSRLLSSNTHGFDKNSTRESLAASLYKNSSNIAYGIGVVNRNTFLIGDALGFEISDAMILNKKPIFPITNNIVLNNKVKNIAFVIGASWESKIYPKEKVLKLCNSLKEKVYIIWGSEEERVNAEWICEKSEYATLAPKLKLDELVSFISQMDLLIGNDTGPTHMAWAQNIPSITLLGPTTTRMIYQTPYNIGIKSPSEVNILKIDKNDFSIKEILYKDILDKAKELLHGL
ncbi:MAG: lipopolysaccharide heptosyltransferase I [Campylobacterota bacterium]|nr:lipopolysaccharide heptosyltransferase I [Campylobacterota bacterium]